jgi:hypothetical protein
VLLPGTPEAGRLARIVAGRGGASLAIQFADEPPLELAAAHVTLPASLALARLLVPSVSDLLASELWGRAAALDRPA